MGTLFALRDVCHEIIPEIATHSNLALPELVKKAAVQCFVHPERVTKSHKYFIRRALLNLEVRGTLTEE